MTETNISILVKMSEGEQRYERKFHIPELTEAEVNAVVLQNPAFFREIFYKRQVNNLYLDTPHLRNYNENVVGAHQRQKVRIRWYGNLLGEIEKPTLEIKIKEGLVGTKRSYRLPRVHLTPGFNFADWLDTFKKALVPECIITLLASYEPTLINQYVRRYYLSADCLFRTTVDSNMRFGAMGRLANNLDRWAEYNSNCVLELKYAPEHDLEAAEVTSVFPFRITKSSKYVNGIDALMISCGHNHDITIYDKADAST